MCWRGADGSLKSHCLCIAGCDMCARDMCYEHHGTCTTLQPCTHAETTPTDVSTSGGACLLCVQSLTHVPRTVEEIEAVMAGAPWPTVQ